MGKNTEISERITQLIENLRVSKNKFAESLGYSRSQSIYDITSGKSAPSFDFFSRLFSSEYSESINHMWIFTGEGEMFKKPEPSLYVKKQLQEQNKETISDQRETIAGLRDVNAGYKELIEHLKGQVKNLQKQLETAGKKTTLTK